MLSESVAVRVAQVTPREGRVSRNFRNRHQKRGVRVTPREGRVSRNGAIRIIRAAARVTPREGRVSRNAIILRDALEDALSRPARGV